MVFIPAGLSQVAGGQLRDRDNPGRDGHAASARHSCSRQDADRRTGRRTQSGPAQNAEQARRPGTGAALAVFTGRASGSTGQFTIGGNGTWTLRWAYTCSALGRRSRFAVSEDGTDPIGGISVSESGPAGGGAARVSRDAGIHYLVVSSACGWALTILPPPAARPG
jgi:hypothetical protein